MPPKYFAHALDFLRIVKLKSIGNATVVDPGGRS